MLYLWTSVTAASFCEYHATCQSLNANLLISSTGLAVAANLLPLAIFRDTALCIIKFRSLSSVLMVAWGLVVLTMQTVLTGHILYRVLWVFQMRCYVSSRPDVHDPRTNDSVCSLQRNTVSLQSPTSRAYTVLLSALIESCVVTWVGLFTYELASFIPHGRLTVSLTCLLVLQQSAH